MVYQEFENCKLQYEKIKNEYDKILREKEELFIRTQPKGIAYDKDNVDKSASNNVMDNYVIALEQKRINSRLNEASDIMKDRKALLDKIKIELKASNETEDIVYRMRYIDKLDANDISLALGYSKVNIYKILERINKSLYKIIQNYNR